MNRHFSKWARRQDISCFRIYDADLKEVPLTIDRYEGMVHISEFQRKDESDITWREAYQSAVAEVLEVDFEQTYYKVRLPQKGAMQYEKNASIGREEIVREGGLQFLVNMTDYLDTGLFLDHRQTRAMVRELSNGKNVLNLFAYTGSFSVYAAAGEATSTLTLDMSKTYIEWAQRNMRLNGFTSSAHSYDRVDVLAWLMEKPRGVFDLIILDPPTFSNSKMTRNVLDLQKDYPALIEACLLRLAPGGSILFSTNHRRFKLAEDKLPGWVRIRNITSQTVPPDFKAGQAHQAWMLTID